MNSRVSCYPSDLSDNEWAILEPLMPEPSCFTHRPREHSWREILNGIFYITRSGCSWRMMPSDLPHWKTVYHYFRLWKKSGFIERLHTTLREKTRVQVGRNPYPTAGSGEWIPSATIEAILSEHPAVAQVAVLAVPDTRWGERPLAVLALIPGAFLQEEELRGFLKEAVAQGRIASYWIPDRFVFVEEIPLTSAGKLHKAKLREMLGL